MPQPPLTRRITRAIRRSIMTALYALPALIVLRFTPYRFVAISEPGRIGHLAIEVDWLLKRKALGELSDIKPILLQRYSKAANPTLLRIWSQHITLISVPVLIAVLRPLMKYFPSLRFDLNEAVSQPHEAAKYLQTVKAWGDRPPIFQLPSELIAKGWDVLRALGMPPNAWFVCVHARDALYSPRDEHLHEFRNSHIANCLPAIDAIIDRGGWCVRMGEPGTPSLPSRPGLINYPETPYKSDWMDLFLASQARFFLGNTSGLYAIPTMVGIPCALANMAPYETCYGLTALDISIPKELRTAKGDMLKFTDIFSSDIANFRHAHQFKQAGLILEENRPDQILELVTEMLDRLDGVYQARPDEEALQDAFRSLLTPRHLTYGSRARIGSAFLREHADLLIKTNKQIQN
jgi:putative glycosyltransferase (TIGR04372 family)